jgi:hypothetical protein
MPLSLLVAKAGHSARLLTGTAFTGTRTSTVDLTAGEWSFLGAHGARAPLALFVKRSSS